MNAHVISKVARDNLGLLEGSDAIIEMSGGEIGIMPVKKDILDRWREVITKRILKR
jgi:hypothetical protein